MIKERALAVKDLAKSCNDVLEKLGWKWEPKVGEWFVLKQNVYLIHAVWMAPEGIQLHYNNPKLDVEECVGVEFVISILSWEEIEKVLEKAGYKVKISLSKRFVDKEFMENSYYCDLYKFIEDTEKGSIAIFKGGKSRQEAVMRAVIELGKEE